MYIIVALVVILAAIAAAALSSMITVDLEYHHHHADDEGHVTVRALWGLVRIQRRLLGVEVEPSASGPQVKVHHTAPTSATPAKDEQSAQPARDTAKWSLRDLDTAFSRVQELWLLLRDARPILRRFTTRCQLAKYEVHAVAGTGDAVSTGVLCGSALSLLHTLSGWVYAQFGRAVTPDIRVAPSFQAPAFGMDVSCILRVRAGHAIIAGFEMIRLWRRRTPRGTSHSRVDEYRHVEYP